jgi:predicted nucleic acid-binding protein
MPETLVPDSPIVVDASIAAKWTISEPGSLQAATLLDGRLLHVPDLLFAEVANAFWNQCRRGALSATAASEGLQWLVDAPLAVTPTRRLVETALSMARALAHPVYDCIYLALAAEVAAPVVTADPRLLAAARRDADILALVLPLDGLDRP